MICRIQDIARCTVGTGMHFCTNCLCFSIISNMLDLGNLSQKKCKSACLSPKKRGLTCRAVDLYLSMVLALVLALLSGDFPISTAPNYTGYPSVCYANNQFYVFWIDQRNLPLRSLYGARVTTDGTVLDPTGRELYTDSAGYNCDVAFDGTNLLAVTRNHC